MQKTGSSSDNVRRLRWSAYFIFTLATILPILETTANLWPFQMGVPEWRFGAIGTMSTMLAPTMIGLLLLSYVAIASGDRAIVMLLVLVGSAALLVALIAAGSFVLDTLQTRSQVRPEVLRRFDFASVLAISRLLFVAVASGWMIANMVHYLRSSRQRRDDSSDGLILKRAGSALTS